MKKGLLILVLIFAAIFSMAADRSLRISTGYTTLSPFTLNASDTINESQTVTFTITNLQKYMQHQTFTVGLTTVTGTPNVAITAYGKVTSSGSWVQIGTPITWTTTGNDGDITSTSPINYNYLKVTFVATGTDQQTKITTFTVRTANAYDIPANSGTLTISRATAGAVTVTSKDDDAAATSTVYRAGSTGPVVFGSTDGTTAIASSDWAIGTTGIMTGIGAITSNGLITGTAGATITGAAVNLNASSNFATNIGTGSTDAAVTIGGNSNTVAINSSGWDITSAGAASGFDSFSQTGTYSMGTYAAALVKALTGSSYLAHVINLVSETNPSSEVSLIGGYAKVSNTTVDQPNLQLVGFAPRVSMGKNALDAYGLQSHLTLVSGANSTGNMTAISGKTILGGNNTGGIVTAGLFTIEGDFHPATAYGVWMDLVDANINAGYTLNVNGGTVDTGILLTKSGDGAYGSEITFSNGTVYKTGTQTSRNAIRVTDGGDSYAIGSVYVSTAGKIYLKVAHAEGDTDWERVTTTAAD
jgi:hypothetical protein